MLLWLPEITIDRGHSPKAYSPKADSEHRHLHIQQQRASHPGQQVAAEMAGNINCPRNPHTFGQSIENGRPQPHRNIDTGR